MTDEGSPAPLRWFLSFDTVLYKVNKRGEDLKKASEGKQGGEQTSHQGVIEL